MVEDDPVVSDMVCALLNEAGYATRVAADGHDAIAGIRKHQPDAILLDISLPRLDGFGVLRALKATLVGRGTPVLMLTAHHADEDVMAAVALGARDYLTKPFDRLQLLARVARLVR